MTSWPELPDDLVFRVQIDFLFQFTDSRIIEEIEARIPPLRSARPRRRGSDSGSSAPSSPGALELDMDEWKSSDISDKEIKASLLEYCAEMLDSSHINGPSPIGKVVCSHHYVHRYSSTHWTLTQSPQIYPATEYWDKAYLRLTSRWYAPHQMPDLLSDLHEIHTILTDNPDEGNYYTWTKHNGNVGIHGYKSFDNARLVVGFNTLSNVTRQPTPEPPSWSTALSLLATWEVIGATVRQQIPSVAPPAGGTQPPETDRHTLLRAYYASRTPNALLTFMQAQHGDVLARDEALNATAFTLHKATFDGTAVSNWVHLAAVIYGFARALDEAGVRLVDAVPSWRTMDWADFMTVIGLSSLPVTEEEGGSSPLNEEEG